MEATIGQKAFDAYRENRGGKNHDGTPTPTWAQLTDGVRAAWEVAGHAAIDAQPMIAAEADTSFGFALRELASGRRVARAGWNGRGMWLALVRGGSWTHPILSEKDGAELDASRFIGMRTVDNHFVPWLASQTDMLATDWEVVS